MTADSVRRPDPIPPDADTDSLGVLSSYVELTDDVVRRFRATCADGSPLAEDCDLVLDHDREPDEDVAAAGDRLVETINQRARARRRSLVQIEDRHLDEMRRDPQTPPSIRWEVEVALGRSKMRANKTRSRRAGARRACLEYWNASVGTTRP